MNAENLLLSAIVAEQDLAPVLEAKVTKEFFANPDDREVFEFILSHWHEYGKVPNTAAVKNSFPTYRFVRGKEPYEYYLDEVRRRRKYGLAVEMIGDATDQLEDDQVEEALDIISTGLLRVFTEVSELRDTNLIETWERRLETYADWKRFGDVLKGIPSGFPTIDDGLRGFQAEQLITFVGSPKAGKSWMMLIMALAAHSYGKVPLFIGFEMSNEEQEARHDAIVAGISYTRLLKGRTTPEEDEALRRELKRRKNGQPFVMSSDPDGATVSGIAAKIDQYKPDIVFVDGVYMMDDEEGEPKGSPQALTNITRSLKKLARRTGTPIVISTQVLNWKINKKRGLDENAIGYTSSFIQDSDVVLGVETVGDDPNSAHKNVKVLLARSAPKFEVGIWWDWEHTSFTEMNHEGPDQGDFGTDLEAEEDEPEVPVEELDEDVWDPKRKVVRRKVRT